MKFVILHYPLLESTNNLAKEFADLGVTNGTVVFADYQTRGRGRFKRKWVSPKGKDLLFSIVIRPREIKAGAASIMTQIVAMSIRDLLKEKLGVIAKIKRPNDLLVDGKKICGILVESSTNSNMIDYMVVGVGLNVNSRKKQLVRGAASLRDILGRETERVQLLQGLLGDFGRRIMELGWVK